MPQELPEDDTATMRPSCWVLEEEEEEEEEDERDGGARGRSGARACPGRDRSRGARRGPRRSAEATVLLDEDGRCVYVNPVACAVLGVAADDLLRRPSPFADGDATVAELGRRQSTRWMTPGSTRERELEHRGRTVTTHSQRLTVVTFRDVTEVRIERARGEDFASDHPDGVGTKGPSQRPYGTPEDEESDFAGTRGD